MSEVIQFEQEGTGKLEVQDQAEFYGKKADLYRCSTSLDYDASVDRYLGAFVGTNELLHIDPSSFGLNFTEVQKEDPVVRIVNKTQEGRALTFQKWKGVVKEILGETFIAEVSDITDLTKNIPEEEAELFLSDVQEDDKELLSVGAVFYWCIGYVYSPSNQVTRASFLRFQRLPFHTTSSIQLSIEKAKEIQDGIDWK